MSHVGKTSSLGPHFWGRVRGPSASLLRVNLIFGLGVMVAKLISGRMNSPKDILLHWVVQLPTVLGSLRPGLARNGGLQVASLISFATFAFRQVSSACQCLSMLQHILCCSVGAAARGQGSSILSVLEKVQTLPWLVAEVVPMLVLAIRVLPLQARHDCLRACSNQQN